MMNDETEEVYLPRNKRKVTSIFVDPDLFKAFYKKCRLVGTSSCSVLEAFFYAFDKGVPNTPLSPLPVVNVNLTINRVVERIHNIDRVKKRRRSYPTKDDYHGSMRNGIIYRDGSRELF